jgi:RNA polymerase sigma factor for flagellar operon FliA
MNHIATTERDVTGDGSEERIKRLVESHLPLVLREMDRIYVAPGLGLEKDDLLSAGALGLLRAAQRFEAGRGTTFGLFARPYVRGAMIDEIRRMLRGSPPPPDTLFAESANPYDPETIGADADALGDPMLRARVKRLIAEQLDDDERLRLTLYFYEDLTLREIAEIVGQSISSVARSISGAVAKLRKALSQEANEG